MEGRRGWREVHVRVEGGLREGPPGHQAGNRRLALTGFHDRAIVLHQAKKLPDVLLIQVDWVAEFADLGMIEPLDERIAEEPKSSSPTSPRPSTNNGAASSTISQ